MGGSRRTHGGLQKLRYCILGVTYYQRAHTDRQLPRKRTRFAESACSRLKIATPKHPKYYSSFHFLFHCSYISPICTLLYYSISCVCSEHLLMSLESYSDQRSLTGKQKGLRLLVLQAFAIQQVLVDLVCVQMHPSRGRVDVILRARKHSRHRIMQSSTHPLWASDENHATSRGQVLKN